jgi:hypothetical protein
MARKDLTLLRGSIDLHIHANPDLRERLLDGFEAAQQAKAVGMKAIVLKNHHIMTTNQAEMASKAVEGIDVFGGITLNESVGGFNPKAVEVAIKHGAKIIWMPTASAASDLRSKGKPYAGGLSVFADGLDHPGKILPEVRDILDLTAKAGVVLGTSHLSSIEIIALLEEAKHVGLKKVLVNHPQNRCVAMTTEQQKEAAEKGAFLEHCFNFCTPHLPLLKPDDLAADIRAIGPSRCIMATDMGQIDNFPPVEGLRVFIQMMLERGIQEEWIITMAHENPAMLLYE